MFIGHFAAGLAAKRIAPRPSLGTLFLAAQFIDLLWPIFLLVGLERVEIDPGNTAVSPLKFVSNPITHSLLGVLLWSLLFGGVHYAIRRSAQSSFVLGSLVLSHWVLDLVVHRPDLPLVPWSDVTAGMGLWNSLPLTMLLEGLLFAIGTLLYVKGTRALNTRGRLAFWGLIAFLLFLYAMNLLGPPPPSVGAIGYVGLFQWLLIAWGYWIDRHRTSGLEVKPAAA